jgi:hypothetical protein
VVPSVAPRCSIQIITDEENRRYSPWFVDNIESPRETPIDYQHVYAQAVALGQEVTNRVKNQEDRFEGGLTEEEKHWASTKSAIRKEFRLSDAYTKSLETMDRVVSIDDYWGAIRWMESLVGEAHRDELLRLIDGLLEPLSPK